MPSRAPLNLGIILASVGLLTSCSTLLGLRKEVETLESRGGITLALVPPPKGPAPTYALAWRMENGQRKDSAGFQQVRADGIASFNLDLGSTYRVGAFTDENGNGALDGGEPFAMEKEVQPIPLADPKAKIVIRKLTLSRDSGPPAGMVIQIPKENSELGGKTNIALGDIASLDEKRFQEDVGGSGLWRPLDFLSTNTIGLYFTEAYDPKRIPVVFVYGIGGSPQDLRWLMEHLDRKKYQMWFFHYPSGMRLDRVSSVLATGLRTLRKRHQFAHCHIIAHSMGGLVSRAALTKAVAEEGENFIPHFVSISTPWGGHSAAESGIRHLKKPVPSWLDVAPGSDFLKTMYATPLPTGTTHDLIYGSIKDGPFYLKEENDGVVTVTSETDPRIMKATRSFRHLLHDHVEILKQTETLLRVEAALAR